MSDFKEYLRAGVLTSLFEKAFLSGSNSKSLARTAFVSLGTFLVVKKTITGTYSLLSAPWNAKTDKTFHALKKVANEVIISGKVINSLQKNTDWMDEKWHSLSFYNTNGRHHISGILFIVHAKHGYMRIFVDSASNELLELTWSDLRRFVGIGENCDLTVENLSEIYQKMQINIL